MRHWKRTNYISKNGFSPNTNRAVGSFMYTVVFLVGFYLGYQIWGVDMFTEVKFYGAQALAFWFVGYFLVKIGFWVYRPHPLKIILNLLRKIL